MSIASSLMTSRQNRLVIPFPGKMFRSNITKTNKALCFCINKGYFEFSDLTTMLALLDDIEEIETIVEIGQLEKIKTSGGIVYRQRIFFSSFRIMINLCRLHGILIDIPDDFRITISSVTNCLTDIKTLEKYAFRQRQTLDAWLTNCCIIHVHYLLVSMHMYSFKEEQVQRILRNKKGYLDRSPFLVSSYSIRKKTSGIFLELNTDDERLFSEPCERNSFYLKYGYTTANVERDRQGGSVK